MRLLSLALLISLAVLPGWRIYSLNHSVDYLRDGPRSVPFFAYYRYGMLTDTIVFNVNASACTDIVADVIPAFRQFVNVMQEQHPREVRLAWQGQTVAVVQQQAMEAIWQETVWDSNYAIASLSRAVRCTSDEHLVIDWIILKPQGSAVT